PRARHQRRTQQGEPSPRPAPQDRQGTFAVQRRQSSSLRAGSRCPDPGPTCDFTSRSPAKTNPSLLKWLDSHEWVASSCESLFTSWVAYRRTPAVQARLDASREMIVKAAITLLTEHGYAGCSVAAVAARAEVATGTVYRHFPSKAELVTEVFRVAAGR